LRDLRRGRPGAAAQPVPGLRHDADPADAEHLHQRPDRLHRPLQPVRHQVDHRGHRSQLRRHRGERHVQPDRPGGHGWPALSRARGLQLERGRLSSERGRVPRPLRSLEEHPVMDRTLRRLLTLAALLGSAAALAQSSPVAQACWNRDVERIDYLQNPPEGGDNAFFTGVSDTSGNTNVTLIWPSHATLMDFTQRLYRVRVDLGGASPTGCSNAYLNGLLYFLVTGVIPPGCPQALPCACD